MGQHFLFSKQSYGLSLRKIARLSEDEAYDAFCKLRWSSTGGAPVCPDCGCLTIYIYRKRKLFKCKACSRQFSVTAGTIFASRKLSISDILMAILTFVNGAKGQSATHLKKELECNYKTAFVLQHKLREAMTDSANAGMVSGVVEVDGAHFGGYVKQPNYKKDWKDLRKVENQNGKRKVIVIARERGGRTITDVFKTEAASMPNLMSRIEKGSIIHADEAAHWEPFRLFFETKQINHQIAFSRKGACTNWAESFFSRVRRAEIGTYHSISGPYLASYAGEMAWRENNRRISNGEQFLLMASEALAHPISRQWKGYYQRTRGKK